MQTGQEDKSRGKRERERESHKYRERDTKREREKEKECLTKWRVGVRGHTRRKKGPLNSVRDVVEVFDSAREFTSPETLCSPLSLVI